MNPTSSSHRLGRGVVRLAAALVLAAAAPLALAEIHIGVILSTTGPAASLGIPEEQAIKLWPGEIAGEKVRFTILNDDSDTTTATKDTQRLVNEDKVDLIIGASVTPTSLAVVETAGNAQVPVISLAGGGAIVLPQDGPRKWAFKLSPTEPISIALVLDHMQKHAKGKSIATIGITTSYGEGFLKAIEAAAPARGIKIVADREVQPDRPERHRAGAQADRRQRPTRSTSSPPARPARCRRSSSRSAATRASSTRPRASPTTTSCASAASRSRAAT